MPKYKIADYIVEMQPQFALTIQRCQQYLSNTDKNPDFTVSVSLDEAECQRNQLSMAEYEYIMLGYSFYQQLISRKGFLLHSSAISLDNEAYLFSAKSGTGKSTHTRLWQELFPNKVIMINDDKPAVRYLNDTFYCCGTPFSGKDDFSTNIMIPIKALIFIQRGKKNSIRKLSTLEAFSKLYEQTLHPKNKNLMKEFLDNIDLFMKKTPMYELTCTISLEAAQLVYDTLKKEKN